jgi:CRISPR/Cas system CMR-associated protein Cmr5 small subunit
VADLLVDKFLAKYEFYASYVHKNAYISMMMLLKADLCVDFIESNLGNIIHLSQQKYNSIYRSNARKILQFLAALRLDPEEANSIDYHTLATSHN